LYTAVIDLAPAPRLVVVKAATPPASVPEPNVALPFLKLTVPVGVPDEETVAVNVTDCPKVEGFSDEVTDVDVGVCVTLNTVP
jgi:hypothetical protein